MEVILLEKVKGLGEMGSIVAVKPGYARNYLIPQSKALRATDHNKQGFLAKKAELDANRVAELDKAQLVYVMIDKNFISIIRQAGEDGKLFGSVSPRDIAENAAQSFIQEILHSQITLEKPIKYIGVHEVKIALHPELHAIIYVNVARTLSEAQDAQKEFLSLPAAKKE